MSRVYVPGYGYVKQGSAGTSGSVKPGQSPKPKNQAVFDPVPPSTDVSTDSPTGSRSSMQGAYGIDAGDPIVSFPNMNWYYSSADVYGTQDPSDPRSTLNQGVLGNPADPNPTPMWNYSVNPTQAAEAYDDDMTVPPGLRAILDSIAETIHPLKQGRSLWEEAVAASALASQRGDYVTPYAVLKERYLSPSGMPQSDGADGPGSYSSGGGSYGGGGYGGGGGGGSVSLTNPTSARGLLMQTMQSVLGRNPSNDEYKTFLQVLNEAEMANPRTASFDGGMAVGSGGVDPGVLALEFAQDQEDFQERQGDGYFRTFMQALAGGV